MIVDHVQRIVPGDYFNLVRADLPEYEKPSLTYDSYIPDVSFSYKGQLIIGEAKTFDDFNREHSRKQYEAYIQECMKFPGESIIVIAIPWQLFITAKNHFVLLKRKYTANVRVLVISENGLVDEV